MGKKPEDIPRYDVFASAQQWLFLLHWAAATVFIGIIGWDNFKNDWEVDVELNFNRWDRIEIDGEIPSGRCTPKQPCFVNKYVNRDVFPKLSLGIMVAMCSYISGAHHYYAYWCYKKRNLAVQDGSANPPQDAYFESIKRSVVVARWVDYAFSSPLMFIVVAILWVSPPDIRDIIYAFSVQFLVILGGYGAEIANSTRGGERDKWCLTVGAWLAYTAVWAYLFVAFGEALGDGGERTCDIASKFSEESCESDKYPLVKQSSADPPIFVYIILFTIFLTFSSFGITHTWKLKEGNPANIESNLRYEVVYSILSFTSKICLLGTMASSVVTRSDGSVLTGDQKPTPDEEADEFAAYYGLATSAGFSLVLAIFFMVQFFKVPSTEPPKYTKKDKIERGFKAHKGYLIFT